MPTLPSRQRLALPVVVLCLGVVGGVVGYATAYEETLAGDPAQVEQIIGCPPEYPKEVFVKESDIDRNGDNIICTDGRGFVDNVIEVDDEGRLKSTGHGNFFDKGEVGFQDLSFSFHGIERGDGGAAKGEFEYHDQTPSGSDLTVHGDVLCLSVTSNRATFIGQVTRSNDPLLKISAFVQWHALDNGEGTQAEPDRASRLYETSFRDGKPNCRERFKLFPTVALLNGNIQIFQ